MKLTIYLLLLCVQSSDYPIEEEGRPRSNSNRGLKRKLDDLIIELNDDDFSIDATGIAYYDTENSENEEEDDDGDSMVLDGDGGRYSEEQDRGSNHNKRFILSVNSTPNPTAAAAAAGSDKRSRVDRFAWL